jgi:hypothetical protein
MEAALSGSHAALLNAFDVGLPEAWQLKNEFCL